MAQTVAVVNATLTATGSGTTDFTSAGFGTPTAAIVIVGNANSTNNPQAGMSLSVGFWDGTNQCAHAITTSDALGTTATYRSQRNDFVAIISPFNTWSAGYVASGVTDGIRLTMTVDNTAAQRFATVILLKGVSAKISRLVLNSTVSGTATTGSLGFAPTAALMLGSGTADNTVASGGSGLGAALLSFGAATEDGTHRMLSWISAHAAATADITALYSETRATAQVSGGAESWSADVTTWGADTITMTSRTAGSGGDDVDILCLGGADLSLLLGTLTTATSTGSADVTTTGIDPAAVLLCLGNTSSTTIATDGTASGISVGASDGTTHGGYAGVDEDAADTTNAESAYSSANAVYSRTSSGGAASDLVVGAVSMGTEKFSVNYTTVSGTARKGWFLAFGPATAGGGNTIAVPAGALTLTGFAPTVTATANNALEVPAGALTLTGFAPTVTTSDHQTVAVPAGTLTLTGFEPTVTATAHQVVEVPAGTLTLTGYEPTVSVSDASAIQVPAGTLTLTGFAPTVAVSENNAISVPLGTLTLTGNAPTVVAANPQLIAVPVGTLTLTGYAPTVSNTGVNNLIAVPLGTLTMAGGTPVVRVSTDADVFLDRFAARSRITQSTRFGSRITTQVGLRSSLKD